MINQKLFTTIEYINIYIVKKTKNNHFYDYIKILKKCLQKNCINK